MFVIKFIFLIIIIFTNSSNHAYAYLDPGTFTIIINFFIAIVSGISAYISLFWSKFKKIFEKKKDIKNDKKP